MTDSKEIIVQSEASTIMQVIEKMASMPDLDMSKIERMFEMHQRMVERNQEQEYNKSMSLAQAEIQPVAANKMNKHTGSLFSDLSNIHKECKPIWTKYGFSVSSSTEPSEIQGHILVVVEVMHSAGFKKIYRDHWPLDITGAKGTTNKTTIQAIGSTRSYAIRYSELAIFDISIERHDNDGNASVPQSLDQGRVKRLRDALVKTGYTEVDVCKNYGVDRFEDLPIANFNPILNKLRKAEQK